MSGLPIVDAQPAHYAQILGLNERFVHFLSPLDATSLDNLIEAAAYFRVVELEGEVTAFLIAMFPGAKYYSPNYIWFSKRSDNFAYVDRIVVSEKARGMALGPKLYDDLSAVARRYCLKQLACEYNVKPMNEGSARFHERYGFKEVGQQELEGGKRVSLQSCALE